MTEQEAYIILNAIPGLGSVRIRRLIECIGSAAKVLKQSLSELIKVDGINKRIAASICSWQKHFNLKKEYSLIKQYNVKILSISDPCYPKLLKEIYDPPVVLYVKGDIIPEDEKALAIVGARKASHYGINTARRLAKELGHCNLTIVSGLARGVDTAAHQGVISVKGRTIAVFGCGIDRIYPPENKDLARHIVENGAIITEFPFGTKPCRENFPMRNRIISGLSLGVIVIEAGKHSGSLITARLATEQGREVFSVPGRIDTATSQGTNILIKNGAKPVLELEDILEELRHLLNMEHHVKTSI